MRYIRTTDGRILHLIEKCEYEENKITYIVGWDWEDNFEINQEDVIKIADTIEELCDEYVIVPKDKKYKPWTEKTLSVFDDFEDVLKHNDIYLSIWVDALLKPVAKLNDKAETKLLGVKD